MVKIGFIAGGSQQFNQRTSAQNMYRASLFMKSRQWVEQNCDRWYILSAKYGLLKPTTQIEPYNVSLNNMASDERWQWSAKVVQAILQEIALTEILVFLASQKYRDQLIQPLEFKGYRIEAPLTGLPIDKQLEWLSKNKK